MVKASDIISSFEEHRIDICHLRHSYKNDSSPKSFKNWFASWVTWQTGCSLPTAKEVADYFCEGGVTMTQVEKIEQIISKMERLNDLWWDSEENHNQAALEEHNSLEQEI